MLGEELTTSAHGALKHLKHETSSPRRWGGGASGGLAVVSQQRRSTTWSLTRRLKHGAACLGEYVERLAEHV
jgi:hypothetical protein